MANINKIISKVSMALKAEGRMPLINKDQFYGDNGPVTKYVVHYGNANERSKKNNIVAKVYSKIELLNVLIEILKDGESYG